VLYRYRVAQIIQLERVRTRIATDLHDDIGASLSKIAILSEVVHQRVAPLAAADNQINEPLDVIAGTSREMVDSMSDIVWAINPTKDHLSDLIGRMRNLAGEMTELCDIGLRVHLSGIENKDLHLGTDLRREVYLIFKETINNLVKHAGCERVEVEFRLESDWLIIKVKDDGCGFDLKAISNSNGNGSSNGATRGGNGLINMRRRAASLGGSYEIESSVGQGTTTTLRVPLKMKKRLPGLAKLLPK
jgi:signal transduction histidine kinase